MTQAEKIGGFDLFTAFIKDYKDLAKDKGTAEYYHVDVVIDAFNRGKVVGKEEGLEDYMKEVLLKKVELFQAKANQIYILSKKLISDIQALKHNACSLHININPNRPNVVIAVADDALLADNFVDTIYENMGSYKKIYFKLFSETLDIGLMSIENIDIDSLKDEGYAYHESFE